MSDNPFLDRMNKKAIGDAGRKSEKRQSKSMGARQMPNSGAIRGHKGDAILGNFRLEMKSSKLQSIALEMGWLSKITAEALSNGQVPAVVITFVTEEGKPRMDLNSEWVMIPKWKFVEMI